MRDRLEPILRLVCLVLAGVILLQVASRAARRDPLAGVRVPKIPPLDLAANPPASQTSSTNNPSGRSPVAAQTNLPPVVQGRVSRINDSEILGPVPRPPVITAALLGIAGKDAFVRTPTGQTRLLAVGEEFGGVKLLQIGTNRVLIEEDGHKKELTMFSGFGSEPLLPKGKEHPQ
jgi:hypothetical protein